MHRIIALIPLLIALATAAVWSDVGPRPPITPTEVKNPQDYLTMVDETVNVTITGRKAHVVADFHFRSDDLWRKILQMRLGFPHLKNEPPYQSFRVLQDVNGSHPPTAVVPWQKSKVNDPKLGAGLDADWLDWPLTLVGSNGRPMASDVYVRVSYDQDVTVDKSGKTGTFRYILRSGAPWKNPIGEAKIDVKVSGPTVVTALPHGARAGGAENVQTTTLQKDHVAWTMTRIEPTEDIVVTLRYK